MQRRCAASVLQVHCAALAQYSAPVPPENPASQRRVQKFGTRTVGTMLTVFVVRSNTILTSRFFS
jgi:hypothetical protein